MKKSDKKTKGYYYEVSEEAIREHMKLSPEQKLMWLREAQSFFNAATPPKSKKLHEKFRRGEI